MFTTTYTDVFSGRNVTPAFPQYSSISLSANITLAWPAQFQNLNSVVSVIMDIIPTADGFTVTMPTAQEAGTGVAFTINNPSAHAFNLLDSTGALIVAIPATTARIIWLISNTTAAGAWRTLPGSAGGSSVTSVNATSSSDNLVIGGVPITSAGTITFTLANDLAALTAFGASAGFSVRRGVNTWALRDIVGTAGSINIVDGDGVAGNPTISLDPDILITTLQAGNIKLSGNTISSVNVNGVINLAPNGTGPVTLSSSNPLKFFATNGTNYISFQGGGSIINQTYIWPTTAPTAGQSLGYSGGSNLAWQATPSVPGATTVNAIARYSNLVGGLKDSPTLLLDDVGNLSLLNSCAIGQIVIGGTGGSSSQTITTTLADASLILAPNGIGAVQCQGDIWMYPVAATSKKIRFYEPTGNHYAGLIANPAIANNYTWSLPIIGGIAGVFYTSNTNSMSIHPFFNGPSVVGNIPSFVDTVGTLQDSGVSIFTGPSTVNAIAKFSNTTGSIQNSNVTLDSNGMMTFSGAVSSITSTSAFSVTSSGNLSLTSTGGGNLYLTSTGGGNLLLESTGGQLIALSNLKINKNAADSMISILNSFNISANIKANVATVADYTLTLPAAVSAGYMRSDSSGNLSFLALTTVSTNIPQFINTIGTIGASPISVSAGGALTGVTSSTFSGMNVGVTSNTIATLSNANLNLVPNGSGIVASTADISLLLAATQLKLRLYNSAGTFYTALQAGAAAANTTFTLPLASPAATGLIKSSSAGVMSIDSLGASAGILRTDGSGNVVINTVASAANEIPKYSNSSGSLAPSFSFLDANDNLFLAQPATGVTGGGALILNSSNAVSVVGASQLAISTLYTGSSCVLALRGNTDGGVSASVSAIVTNKISIYVNGTRYYLLASTSAT